MIVKVICLLTIWSGGAKQVYGEAVGFTRTWGTGEVFKVDFETYAAQNGIEMVHTTIKVNQNSCMLVEGMELHRKELLNEAEEIRQKLKRAEKVRVKSAAQVE